jgi:TolA-binding protein
MKISVKQLKEMISEAVAQATDAAPVSTNAPAPAQSSQSGRTFEDVVRAIDRLHQSIINVANRTTQRESELEQRIVRLEQSLAQKNS